MSRSSSCIEAVKLYFQSKLSRAHPLYERKHIFQRKIDVLSTTMKSYCAN
jgi:hypothetical protein